MQQGTNCQIGINVSLSPDTVLGDNVTIGNNVTLYPKVNIGDNCRILDGAVIGRLPISAGNTNLPLLDDYRPVEIGPGSVIGCNAVLYTGITLGKQVLICDLSSVREGCVLHDQVVLGRGVLVNYDTQIGKRSRIMDSTHITGNMVIEEDVFISCAVATTNDNDVYLTRFGSSSHQVQGPIVRRFAVVGANAALMPGIEVGEGAMVASGAVVTKDVSPWKIVAGVPARHFRDISAEWREQILNSQR
jgi:acetyltransferase-like isoleucine patch superfamily enzyme